MDRETVMYMWDERRAAIAGGDKSSAPRDWFEALLDALDGEREDAVAAEREACATVCEGNDVTRAGGVWNTAVKDCATKIRMRSNAIAQGREHSERPAGAEGSTT